MKKALWIISVISGIICAASAVILGCIYLENVVGVLKRIKNKVTDRLCCGSAVIDEEYDY